MTFVAWATLPEASPAAPAVRVASLRDDVED